MSLFNHRTAIKAQGFSACRVKLCVGSRAHCKTLFFREYVEPERFMATVCRTCTFHASKSTCRRSSTKSLKRERSNSLLYCRAEAHESSSTRDSVSVVLLAGGSGKRMGAPIPKQYLELAGQPIAIYSLQVFAQMPEVFEIVIVCHPDYRDLFEKHFALLSRQPKVVFADPGAERQDSVSNGFKAINRNRAQVVAIHDSARPLITPEDTRNCIQDALDVGAAVLGVPVKPTIKEVQSDGMVVKTLQRANLWEVQTPQVIKPDLLEAGFELVLSEKLEVTDDVSIIEALGKPVKITKGSYTNIKVTTPDDMVVAVGFLGERGAATDVTPSITGSKELNFQPASVSLSYQ